MARVAIIMASFPYGTPEQFFEAEVPVWASSGHEVTLFPMRSGGPMRAVPDGVNVSTALAVLDTSRRRGTPTNLVLAACDPSTLREVRQLAKDRKFSLRGAAEIISTEAQVRYLRAKLEEAAARNGGFDLVYSYWHGPAAYAAASAARSGSLISSVVARAHRVDLYEESRSSGHHPRKRHYQRFIDLHAPISASGAKYLESTFGVSPENIYLSRLGCQVRGLRARTSGEGRLHLLSVSFVTPIKRVDSILEAVALVARLNPGTHVEWTHLGSGPLFSALQEKVENLTAKNLTVNLPGQVPHADVAKYLENQPVDVFINFSTSEGVPVSIMEAMSFGVPAVAPAVGGVSEIVGDGIGTLLSADASITDLAEAVSHLSLQAKSAAVRDSAAQRIALTYDAKHNFEDFISEVTSSR